MEKKKEKLLLIDGHSIVNRTFYGIPPLTNAEGIHTNAIMGFLNIFLNAYKEFAPDYVIVAFDVRQKTFRHEMYDRYKGTRKPMPPELHEQVPYLKDVLNAMGVKTVELPGYEADDVIGTYGRIAGESNVETVILSGDRDLLQLATDTTMVAIPKTKGGVTEVEKYFEKDVIEKYSVTPKQFVELRALMGDASDNIPGIPGIGEKTATNIITQFGSLENAYEHAEEIQPNKARENLKEYIGQGRISRALATINTASPVELDFKEGKVGPWEAFFNDDSYVLMKRLELKKIIDKFETDAVSKLSEAEYVLKDAAEFPEDVEKPCGLYISPCRSLMALSVSGKTVVFKGYNKKVISLLLGRTYVYCFGLKQLLHTVEMGDIYHESVMPLDAFNGADAEDVCRAGNVFDIEVMAYLLNPLSPSYPFDGIAKDYLGRMVPSERELLGKKSVEAMLKEAPEKCFALAAHSAAIALDSAKILTEELRQKGMWDLYINIEMPLTYPLYNMERIGVRVDRKALDVFADRLEEMALKLQAEIYEEAGEEFNINSPSQLGTILFEKMKLPHRKKTKTGYSTSADVLEKLAGEFPFVTKILEYRQVVKLRSTYAVGLTEYIGPDDRIHGRFNQTVTATGRISSADPNLQNIPIRTELGQEIRKAFIAGNGCVFLDADYSQIELRLLAHLSDDANLIEAYRSDADIHRITASKVFNTPIDEVTWEQRSNAKAVNFGIVYGISSFGLGQGLSISQKQAGEYIKQYFLTYPGVKEYLDNIVRQAKIDGYVTTLFGRRRPIPELSSSNFMQRSFGERAAMNSPIQGTAADIMKLAMINVDRELRRQGLKARIVLQVHDELLVETPFDEIMTVKEILNNEMKNVVRLSVDLEVETEQGVDWFEAH
ncbi:MAG: DNA polymerase I [Lachnospiraceae bacterium]|jgi:DNA polymerase-1